MNLPHLSFLFNSHIFNWFYFTGNTLECLAKLNGCYATYTLERYLFPCFANSFLSALPFLIPPALSRFILVTLRACKTDIKALPATLADTSPVTGPKKLEELLLAERLGPGTYSWWLGRATSHRTELISSESCRPVGLQFIQSVCIWMFRLGKEEEPSVCPLNIVFLSVCIRFHVHCFSKMTSQSERCPCSAPNCTGWSRRQGPNWCQWCRRHPKNWTLCVKALTLIYISITIGVSRSLHATISQSSAADVWNSTYKVPAWTPAHWFIAAVIS